MTKGPPVPTTIKPQAKRIPQSSVAAAELYHTRGFGLRKEGRFAAAVEQYSKAIELNPTYV